MRFAITLALLLFGFTNAVAAVEGDTRVNQKQDSRVGMPVSFHSMLVQKPTPPAQKLRAVVRIPVSPIGFPDSAPPKHIVDFVFPKWSETGVNEEKELLIAFELRSPDGHMGGSLWGFRKDPHAIRPLGQAVENPTGTDTSLNMFGSASLVRDNNQTFLESIYEFPNALVSPGWLAGFKQDTSLFSIAVQLRKDLPAADANKLMEFWKKLFKENGSITFSLSDQNDVIEYDVKLQKVGLEERWLRASYATSSTASLKTKKP